MSAPLLLVTVDVEEDMPGWRIQPRTTCENVHGLRRLAELCRELGVLPTYLCDYPVVEHPESAAVLRDLARAGGCELGTHLHPWNTPPYRGIPGRDVDERSVAYYMSELDAPRFRAKLEAVHERVAEVAGQEPRTFRAGRFGIDPMTMGELVRLGYEVDTSVTPLADHTADQGGPDFRSAPQLPYRPHAQDVNRPGDLPIVEVPVSIALTRRLPRPLQRTYVHLPRRLRLRGLLSRDYLGLVDFAWLYPVRFDAQLMSRAADVLIAAGSPVLNVFFHSSELVPGRSGSVRTEEEVETFYARLRALLDHALTKHAAVPATLRDAGRALRPSLGLTAPTPRRAS